MNKKYYQMRDVSRILDIPASTIRFWEDNFPQLKPSRSSGGHRAYDHSQLERLKYIKSLLKEEGLTIEGAKKRLSVEKKGKTVYIDDTEEIPEGDPPLLSESASFKSAPPEASDSDKQDLELINRVKNELLEILRILKRA
jgi:DNA-binding transcriptional MerR regulator